MNDPRPLLDEGATDLEAALLREACGEQPSPEALARTLRTLGVATAVVAAGAATSAVGLKSSLFSVLAKLFGALFLVAAVAGGVQWRGAMFGWISPPPHDSPP